MNITKNILLLAAILLLSYFTADYFGTLYDKFSPQSDDSWFSLDKQALIFMAGLPFAYFFFTILFIQTFGFGNRNKWTGWLLVPPLIFFVSGDLKHIYLPIILGFAALGLSIILRKVFKIGFPKPQLQ